MVTSLSPSPLVAGLSGGGGSSSSGKFVHSPVIKFSTMLVRPVATGEIGRRLPTCSVDTVEKNGQTVHRLKIWPIFSLRSYVKMGKILKSVSADRPNWQHLPRSETDPHLSSFVSDKRAFYLLNTTQNGPQIYELIASSMADRSQ